MTLPDLNAWEGDSAAAPVLAELQRGRWRKARDAAKELCRKEKARYLPLLVAANAGLAEDLLSRGLIQDAAAVLEYLKTIAPPEVVAALQLKQAAGEAEAALVRATGGKKVDLALWTLVESASRGLDSGQEATLGAIRAADFFVTSSFSPPDATQPAAVELLAVQAAVMATGEGQWETAREKLQGLPRRSLFQHWRLFLRGVRHAHHRESSEAQRCFDALPQGSGPARAAALYRDLLGLPTTADHAPTEASLPMLGALAGLEPGWATAVGEAQRNWSRGQLPKAYDALAKSLASFFPSEEPGFGAVLTDVVLASCAGKSSLPHDAQQDLVASLLDRHFNNKFRSDRERAFVIRFFLHEDGRSLSGEDLEDYGLELTALWAKMRIKDPLRESALWTLLAENLNPPGPRGGMVPPVEYEQKVLERFYERAAALDPENAAPAVQLARFFLVCGHQSRYNAHLTTLTKRFPGDKTVLVLGAEEAARRKSYPKALKALRLAREADPMDSAVVALMVRVLQEQAISLVKKRLPVPDTLWQEMEPLLLETPALPDDPLTGIPFGRLRWTAQTLRGLLEKGADSGDARSCAPGSWAHHFMVRILQLRHGLGKTAALPIPPARWLDLRWMQHLALWDPEVADLTWRDHTKLSAIMGRCIGHLEESGALLEDPAGLLEVVLHFQKVLQQLDRPGREIGDNACFQLVNILAAAAGKKRSSYQIRLAAIILPLYHPPHSLVVPDLEMILREANAAGDSKTAGIATYYLHLSKKAAARKPDHGSGFVNVPPEEDSAFGEVMGSGEDDEDPVGEAENILQVVQIIAALIKLYPKSRIQELERSMEADGMDRETWKTAEKLGRLMAKGLSKDQAAAILESGGNLLPLPPEPSPLPEPRLGRPTPKKPAGGPDPLQPELF